MFYVFEVEIEVEGGVGCCFEQCDCIVLMVFFWLVEWIGMDWCQCCEIL